MPATMVIQSRLGAFDFADHGLLPLITRGVDYVRRATGPTDRKRVDVTLSGFFEGDSHDEVCEKYQTLKEIIDVGDRVDWTYTDGISTIADGPVTITRYTEPEEWKEFDGNYTIEFYYFERADMPAYGSLDTSLKASFSNGAGTINFNPLPNWERSAKPVKGDIVAHTLSPSGAPIGSEVTITLSGTMTDVELITNGPSEGDPEGIYDLQESILSILSNPSSGKTGTLTYGYFSEEVYVEDVKFAEGTNIDSFDYTITFKYHTEEIIELSAVVRYPRIHSNPKIIERPFCGNRRITFGNVSGQAVTYSISIKAQTVSTAQSLVANEIAALVVPGGIEMDGGEEVWDYGKCTVSVTIIKFYNSPILSNLG